MDSNGLISREQRRLRHRENLEKLHETKDFYDQIRRTTTLSEAEAAAKVRNALNGTTEVEVPNPEMSAARKTEEMARKIAAVRENVKEQYRTKSNGDSKRRKNPLPSSEYLDYESNWATTYCNIFGGFALVVALVLLYIMWFTDLIK